MPKELARVTAMFADIEKRVTPMLANMERLDNNFWNPDNGTWNRLYVGIDMLAERLKKLGAANASDAKAVNDAEVKMLNKGIAMAKQDSAKISHEFWTTVTRVEAITNEVRVLKAQVDKIVKEKSGVFKRSNSVGQLQQLSKALDNFRGNLVLACGQGPHKPDQALLK